MSDLLDCIRLALADGVTPEARQAGAAACCAVYAALSPPPGVPLTVPHAARVAPLAGVGSDQMLELAIAKLRAMVPAGTEVTTASIRFPFLSTGGDAP